MPGILNNKWIISLYLPNRHIKNNNSSIGQIRLSYATLKNKPGNWTSSGWTQQPCASSSLRVSAVGASPHTHSWAHSDRVWPLCNCVVYSFSCSLHIQSTNNSYWFYLLDKYPFHTHLLELPKFILLSSWLF